MASDSSAKAGSNVLRGNGSPPWTLSLADSRKDDREEGRSGVVGRDVWEREVGRFALDSWESAMVTSSGTGLCY